MLPSAVPPGPTKRDARRQARALRSSLATHLDVRAASQAVAARVLDTLEFPPGTVASAFWPMDEELDLRDLLHTLHARGCVCALPVVVAKGAPLVFRMWEPGITLVVSSFGVPEPGPDRPTIVPQVSLVPWLLFDADGYRLGYGGGFYDRTIAKLRTASPDFTAVGVGFAAQEVPQVPREPHDQRLDWVVTEQAAREIPNAARGAGLP